MYIRTSGKGLFCYCGQNYFLRVHRRWWMKFVPGSRLYRCDDCKEMYWVLKSNKHLEPSRNQFRPNH